MKFKKIISSTLCCFFIIFVGTSMPVKATNNKIIEAKYNLVTEVFDYGQQVSKIVIDSDTTIKGSTINKDTFLVIAKNELNEQKMDEAKRNITNVYVSDKVSGKPTDSGEYIILELEHGASVAEASTLFWDFMKFSNSPLDLKYYVTQNYPIEDINGNQINKNNFKLSMNGVNNLLVDDLKKATSKSGLNYRYFEPKKDFKKKPLIIWLHGAGEGGTNNTTQITGNRGGVAFITEDVQKKFGGAYVIAPQCPTFWMQSFFHLTGDKDYTQDLIDLIKEYMHNNPDIDSTRVYIGGCSMGGYQTLKTVVADPDLFASAFPICPAYEPTHEELDKLGNLPIWFTHAKSDPTVPYTNSKNAYEYLDQISDSVNYSEYETVTYGGINYYGHSSWIYVLNNDPVNEQGQHIFDWLSKQVNVNGHRWQN
ncbi:prolyl oligopeptidase family serine peptidase [Clostridium gasigenes]|uniref:prolyl oligopeptidase family serine peptidase n=1 Tax=Clostridium gasigenes TaxID=94869 RepID=UPI001C0C6600|nr:prolyl oligopeptidase family serine peptidase [Clostridium gasigenes]MBU3107850.1 prolyl oligopeptidase family serine peptidase [Clostridium gasigenes]